MNWNSTYSTPFQRRCTKACGFLICSTTFFSESITSGGCSFAGQFLCCWIHFSVKIPTPLLWLTPYLVLLVSSLLHSFDFTRDLLDSSCFSNRIQWVRNVKCYNVNLRVRYELTYSEFVFLAWPHQGCLVLLSSWPTQSFYFYFKSVTDIKHRTILLLLD